MKTCFVLLLAFILCAAAHPHGHHFRNHRGDKHFSYSEAFKRFSGIPRGPRAEHSPTIYVVDYGADPTGQVDSSDAFQAAIDEAMKRGNGTMSDDIKDCGGVTIDLEGGLYLFDKPIYFPQFTGNWKMTSGTVRASEKFPADKHIIIVGANKCDNPQGSCNEHISFAFMTFDANLQAAGGLQIFRTMGGNVGPNIMFIGYPKSGLDLEGGHEVMVHQAWFGEYWYEGGHQNITSELGIGVLVNGNDHILNDVIFFWSGTAVEINGGATLLRGVHTWSHNTGIIINAEATRLENCYIDWNNLIVKNFEHNLIIDTFFLHGSAVLAPQGNAHINGFIFERSHFDGNGIDTVTVDEKNGHFESIRDCYITETIASHTGYNVRQSQLKRSLRMENSDRFEIDFKKHLVFGKIHSAQYSVQIESDNHFVRHALLPIQDNTKAVVVFEEPVTATVTVSVDESEYTYEYDPK